MTPAVVGPVIPFVAEDSRDLGGGDAWSVAVALAAIRSADMTEAIVRDVTSVRTKRGA